MVHTLEPWTSRYKMVKIFGQIDSGELAARLGALSTEDRRGNIVWGDGFEDGIINWTTSAGGTGAAIIVDGTTSWMGNNSLKLTTGNVAQDESYILKDLTIPSDTKIGLEFHVKMAKNTYALQADLSGFDGTNEFTASIIYMRNTDTLFYFNAAGGAVVLSTDASPTWQNHLWVLVKLVLDWETNKWIRCIFGDVTYDLADVPLYTSADARHKSLQIKIRAKVFEAANRSMWIDNVILTQNES